MRGKLTSLLSVSTACLLLLTACGGNDTGGDADGGTGKKTINVALWDENAKGFLDETIALYKKDHPNVDVKVTYTPFADYWTKLKTSLAGKGGPDVFWINGPHIYAYASSGLIKNLQPLIVKDKLDTSIYTPALVDLYTYEKNLYGIPYFLDSAGLFYNKEIFDKAGIKYPDGTWTWDTLKENAPKLTDKSKGVYGYIAPIANQGGYYNYIHQAGGYVINEERTKSGFDSPEALAAFQWMDTFMKNGSSPSGQQQIETEGKQLFGSGKAAMYPALSVNSPEFHKLLGDKLGVAPLPAGKHKASIVHGLSWSINQNTPNEQEAWDLVKVLTSKEGNENLAKSGFSIPAYKGTEAGWVKSIPSLDLKVFVDSVEFGVAYPVSQKTAEWQAVETKELQNAFLGKKSYEDALKTIASEMNNILATEKKQ
ncbi:ABC transporter substrate-binding protein [Paenibacillus xerothermodurans]|uniref:Sugar ABC transporter substrate-binding protein n=1 Tax=Paenibacillus xerothermodurans TaxID=1977292 RepID=A0A2W1N9A2_PAEXE|nr:sugar ABC transporter substrate-binding protein [Paenibacillus xerothermodurans]PZE20504.1 sugar ABC transporter substrate-binding protein [Paenibacillus xerothermodurans]